MFGQKQLAAEQFPLISAETVSLTGSLENLEVSALLVFRDERWPINFAATVTLESQQLAIDGQFELLHSQLGLKPFSAGFGTLKVSDALVLVFHLVATRESDLP
jgi:hypothetical protein